MGGNMPRYYFNIMLRNRVITDPTRKELAGLEAAHWRATWVSSALSFTRGRRTLDLQIEDETRRTRELFVPSFAPALPRPLNTALTARAHRKLQFRV